MDTTHPNEATGKSQCDRLEEFFRKRPGEWHSGPDLAAIMTGGTGVGTTPCRRIHELRHDRGMTIEHKRNFHTEDDRGVYGSYYRFLPEGTIAQVPTTPPSPEVLGMPKASVEHFAENLPPVPEGAWTGYKVGEPHPIDGRPMTSADCVELGSL